MAGDNSLFGLQSVGVIKDDVIVALTRIESVDLTNTVEQQMLKDGAGRTIASKTGSSTLAGTFNVSSLPVSLIEVLCGFVVDNDTANASPMARVLYDDGGNYEAATFTTAANAKPGVYVARYTGGDHKLYQLAEWKGQIAEGANESTAGGAGLTIDAGNNNAFADGDNAVIEIVPVTAERGSYSIAGQVARPEFGLILNNDTRQESGDAMTIYLPRCVLGEDKIAFGMDAISQMALPFTAHHDTAINGYARVVRNNLG